MPGRPSRAAEAKRIALSVEPRSAAVPRAADREGLREILDNLIDNAIKYTPEGGEVTVGWSEEQGAGAGPGSPGLGAGSRYHRSTPHAPAPSPQPLLSASPSATPASASSRHQKRVFERFYRVDKARSRELGGTGLGLAIVKHLAQSFGGRVGVESEPGQGSTFRVELPAA